MYKIQTSATFKISFGTEIVMYSSVNTLELVAKIINSQECEHLILQDAGENHWIQVWWDDCAQTHQCFPCSGHNVEKKQATHLPCSSLWFTCVYSRIQPFRNYSPRTMKTTGSLWPLWSTGECWPFKDWVSALCWGVCATSGPCIWMWYLGSTSPTPWPLLHKTLLSFTAPVCCRKPWGKREKVGKRQHLPAWTAWECYRLRSSVNDRM